MHAPAVKKLTLSGTGSITFFVVSVSIGIAMAFGALANDLPLYDWPVLIPILAFLGGVWGILIFSAIALLIYTAAKPTT